MVNSLAKKALSEVYIKEDLNLRLDTDYSLTLLCLHYFAVILSDRQPKSWENCLSNVSYRHQTREPQDRTLNFLHYACQFWPTHFLRIEEPDHDLKKEVMDFLMRPGVAERWFRLYPLSNGLSSGFLFEKHPEASTERQASDYLESVDGDNAFILSSGQTQLLMAEGILPAESTPVLSQTLEMVAVMAGYFGLTSIIPEIFGGSELKMVKIKRGYSERNVVISNTVSSLHIAYAIANGDGGGIKHLLRDN